MALMDKMKAQAAQLAQKAQEAGKAGQSKIEEVQARRRADNLLRDLGRAVYSQRTGVADPETEVQIENLVAELKTHESENGPLGVADGDDIDQSDGEAPEGDFKL